MVWYIILLVIGILCLIVATRQYKQQKRSGERSRINLQLWSVGLFCIGLSGWLLWGYIVHSK